MDRIFHRRNLPHLYYKDGIYFITARTAGSIPLPVLKKLKINKYFNDDSSFDKFKNHFTKYDAYLENNSTRNNYLSNEMAASILQECLHYPDNKEYFLICYTIMSNHFHLVFELLEGNKGVSKIMQSIKGVSARRINEVLNRKGTYWQDESYDRLVRDDKELYFVIRYTLNNPVKAGLCKKWDEWKYTYCHPQYVVI